MNIDFNFEMSQTLNHGFISILLKNGYIEEDYIDYISLFHEESIPRSDHKYLISIRNKVILASDYKLSN